MLGSEQNLHLYCSLGTEVRKPSNTRLLMLDHHVLVPISSKSILYCNTFSNMFCVMNSFHFSSLFSCICYKQGNLWCKIYENSSINRTPCYPVNLFINERFIHFIHCTLHRLQGSQHYINWVIIIWLSHFFIASIDNIICKYIRFDHVKMIYSSLQHGLFICLQ